MEPSRGPGCPGARLAGTCAQQLRLSSFGRAVATDPLTIRIRNDELRTVREATRDFGSLLTELEVGDVEKLVLTQRNRIRAVVVTIERWSEMEQVLANVGQAQASTQAEMQGSPSPRTTCGPAERRYRVKCGAGADRQTRSSATATRRW